jgi:hypothetical protein
MLAGAGDRTAMAEYRRMQQNAMGQQILDQRRAAGAAITSAWETAHGRGPEYVGVLFRDPRRR